MSIQTARQIPDLNDPRVSFYARMRRRPLFVIDDLPPQHREPGRRPPCPDVDTDRIVRLAYRMRASIETDPPLVCAQRRRDLDQALESMKGRLPR